MRGSGSPFSTCDSLLAPALAAALAVAWNGAGGRIRQREHVLDCGVWQLTRRAQTSRHQGQGAREQGKPDPWPTWMDHLLSPFIERSS